ncbi:MAG: hypothetical protein QM737_15555 [Ferruginibacter sp.]
MATFISKTVKAGLLVGTLDISAAFIQYYIKNGKNPLNVLTFISSAVFGPAAFSRGDEMKVWGLLFHFGVAYSFTCFFFLVFPKLYRILKNKIVIAILYGPFMWAVMQYIVLSLTAAPKITPTLQSATIAILILIFCIAIPLSYIAGKYYRNKK